MLSYQAVMNGPRIWTLEGTAVLVRLSAVMIAELTACFRGLNIHEEVQRKVDFNLVAGLLARW